MSLVEIVVAMVIIAISLTGTLMLVDTTTRRSADPMLERQATSIAESYLEEALQKNYLDPTDGTLCPTPEGARALFDNVCDFNGLDDAGARDQSGNAITGLDGYRVQVSVDTAANLGTLFGSSEVLRVDITVTDPTGRPLALSGYRTSL
jgi:MSHA pilin protein MshD